MGFGGKSQNVMDVSEWCIVTRTFSGEERLWVVLWENKVNGTQKLIRIGKNDAQNGRTHNWKYGKLKKALI